MNSLRKLALAFLGGVVSACAGTQQGASVPAPGGEALDERALRRGIDELRAVDEGYYENIIRQISRCFRPPPDSGGREATVFFSITADGSVTDVRLHESSGDPDLDSEALGAISDCAGTDRFGPLPEGFKHVPLQILFTFRPAGSAGVR